MLAIRCIRRLSEPIEPIVLEAVNALRRRGSLHTLALKPSDAANIAIKARRAARRSILIMKPLVEVIVGHTLHPPPHIIGIRSVASTIIHSTRSQPPHLIISVANEDNSISIVMLKRSGKQALHVVVSKGVNIHKYSLFRRHGIDNFDIFVVGHNCRGHTIFIPKTI